MPEYHLTIVTDKPAHIVFITPTTTAHEAFIMVGIAMTVFFVMSLIVGLHVVKRAWEVSDKPRVLAGSGIVLASAGALGAIADLYDCVHHVEAPRAVVRSCAIPEWHMIVGVVMIVGVALTVAGMVAMVGGRRVEV